MSCLINNKINISDELINLICHHPEIQRMAISGALNKRIQSGNYSRIPITPMTLNDIAAKLAMLQESDQVAGVKEYIRKLLCHGAAFPGHYNKVIINGVTQNASPVIIDAIPSVLKLSEITDRPLKFFYASTADAWPSELLGTVPLLHELAEDLLSHVRPSPPDLRQMISASDEKSE